MSPNVVMGLDMPLELCAETYPWTAACVGGTVEDGEPPPKVLSLLAAGGMLGVPVNCP